MPLGVHCLDALVDAPQVHRVVQLTVVGCHSVPVASAQHDIAEAARRHMGVDVNDAWQAGLTDRA